MKNESIQMSREVWECFREYRKAPFKKRYQEILEMEDDIDFEGEYDKLFNNN